jgi:hypothetical protein
MKVYIVEEGEYDAYVIGVYSTREKAQAKVDDSYGLDREIVEWEVDKDPGRTY